MSLSKQIYALANLGIFSVVHYVKKPFVSREKKGIDRFIKNYQDDKLTYLAETELAVLPMLESCISCGLCDAACPIYEQRGPTVFPGPSFLINALSRSMPDMAFAGDFIELLSECRDCNECSIVCPQNIDFAAACEFVKAHHQQLLS